MTRWTRWSRRAGLERGAVAGVLLAWLCLTAAAGARAAPPADASNSAGASPLVLPLESAAARAGGEAVAPRLRTPKAALEFFVEAGRRERFEEAAQVLDLGGGRERDLRERGADLARKLHFVLDRKLDIDWRALPDRPDGANDAPQGFGAEMGEAARALQPRRNLLVGRVDLDDHEAEVRLERLRTPQGEPVWLISKSTVRSIDALYEEHGPGWLDRVAPSWALATFGRAPVWQWLGFLILLAASAALGRLLQRLAGRLMMASERRWMRGLAGEVAGPVALVSGLAVLYVATSTLLTLTGPLGRWISTALVATSVVALTWLGTSVINFFSEYVVKHHVDDLAKRDEARARRHLTYLSVARRAFIFLVALLGLGLVLAQFSTFRTLGASLLASAGVASIVLGVAAHGSLSNIMAGIQIALTQLVSIGDTVYFENEWGYVEDITYTFVIIRTWDQRRIAVPNQYVISHPLENWEMTSSHLIMPIVLYVDYSTPVDVLRRKYAELLEASEEWDGEQEPDFEVTAVREDVLEVRGLCSGRDAVTSWRLHCHLREALVAFLRDWDGGRYLPRRRLQLQGEAIPDRSAGERGPVPYVPGGGDQKH